MNLSFGNGALLWGSLLFAVPLIIHLLNRRRFRPIQWAAMDFLRQAYQRTRRRLTLESLLLLLVRCLLVILLAIALARPFVPSSSLLSLFTPAQKNVVLMIDVSHSMGRTSRSGESSLDRAKAQVRRLLEGLSGERGDQITILTLADSPRTVQARTSDLPRAAEAIERLQLEWKSADLVRSLEFLTETVLAPGSGHHEVYLLTDLQRATFDPGAAAGAPRATGGEATPASALRQAAARDASFVAVDCGDPAAPGNLAVEELAVRPQNAIAGEIVRLSATVRNHGGREQRGVVGTFVVDGRRELSRQVTFDVPAGGTATVETTSVFHEERSATVEFQLPEDELQGDDRRFLAFPVSAAVRVLLVDGDFEKGPELRATAEVADMLNPTVDPEAGGSVFRLRVIDDRKFNLRSENLTDYDLIVLADVPRFDAKVAEELSDAVRAGAGLLAFLGEQVDPAAWNEQFYRADGTGLLPALLKAAVGSAAGDAANSFALRIDDFDHPSLQLFADPVFRPQLMKRRVRKFFTTEIGPKDAATAALIRVEDDPARPSPLVLEKAVGRGRVVLWTTSADRTWADFADGEGGVLAYLPLMQDTATYLTLPNLAQYNLGIGERLRQSTRGIPSEAFVVTPSGAREAITEAWREREYGQFVLPAWDKTREPGLYALELAFPLGGAGADSGGRVTWNYAVNVEAAESDLTRVEERAFADLYPGVAIRFATEVETLPRAAGESREGELWRALLLSVIGLLAAELLLGWWFGRGGRGGAT